MTKTFLSALLLVVVASNSIAQTKEQTEAWIIQQTEMNPYAMKPIIEGHELISRITMASVTVGGETIQKAIPINLVTTIAYTHTSEYLSQTMTCDKPCACLLEEPDQKRPKFLFEIYRQLDAAYVSRMNSALLHLVKLHGGKAKVVKADAPKPAF